MSDQHNNQSNQAQQIQQNNQSQNGDPTVQQQYGDQGNEGQYGQGQYDSEGKPDPHGKEAQEMKPDQPGNQSR